MTTKPVSFSRKRSEEEDPFFNPQSSAGPTMLAQTLAEARASLRNPTRPITPAQPDRRLFYDNSAVMQSRPSSSAEPPTARAFEVASSAPDTPSGTPRAPTSAGASRPGLGSSSGKRRSSAGASAGAHGVPAPLSPPAASPLQRSSSGSPPNGRATAAAAGAAAGTKSPAQPVHPGETAQPRPSGSRQAHRKSLSSSSKGDAPDAAAASASASASAASAAPAASATATATAAAPASGSPQPKISGPEAQQWSALRQVLPAIEAGVGGEGGPAALAAALSKAIELVDEPTRAFDFRATSSPKRLQYVLHLLGNVMASPEAIKNHDILARLCKLYLILAPGGTVLTAAAKTVYALSKDKANDARFRAERLVDSVLEVLGRVPSDKIELQSLLYLTGSLKHSSENEGVRQALVALNALQPLARLMRPETLAALQEQGKEKGRTKVAQMLVQVTATLRNVAVSARETKKAFVESGAVALLCSLLPQFSDQFELTLNVCRILSKLTLFPECLDAVSKVPGSVDSLLKVLWKYSTSSSLVVRACFILGNLTGEEEPHRVAIANTPDAINSLFKLLEQYVKLDDDTVKAAAATKQESSPEKATQTKADEPPQQSQQSPTKAPAAPQGQQPAATLSEIEQVLIKLIRLLANIAISREVGPVVASTRGVDILRTLLERKSPVTHEELVLNIVGAITNFSFYAVKTNEVLSHQVEISKLLFPLLQSDNDECVIESVRAFGNFSRSEEVRSMMFDRRIDEVMSLLLEHKNKEVSFNACGVLMNLATDRERLSKAVADETVPRLLKILSSSDVESDAETLIVSCKALFNLFIEDGAGQLLSITQLAELKRVLERVTAQCGTDESRSELLHVAQQLTRLCAGMQVKQ